MPKSYPEWPTGEQVQIYLEAYVDHFGFRDALRLNSEVVEATPRAASNGVEGWTVLTRSTVDGSNAEESFDYLVICNGIFSLPAVPCYPGEAEFRAAGGLIIHTSQFTDPSVAEGKDLIVVGYGKSSCDVAMATVGRAATTTLVARNLIWKIPKKLANVLNFKHLFLNRLGEGLFRYIDVRGFERFLHGPGRSIRNGMMGSVQGVISRQLGLKEKGLEPDQPLETIARSTVSLVTDGFYEAVGAGAIAFRRGEITALEPGKATLSDGATIPAQVVVCGTGWHQRCDFLEPAVLARVTDSRGNFRLYRSMLPVGVPRLAFNGYNSSFFSQLNAEVSALWLADMLRGGLKLPTEAEQAAYIDRRLAWMEERTDGKHSKGTNIIPFSVHHMDEMLREIDLELPLATRVKHWLVAIDAADYRGLLPRLLRRHGLTVPTNRRS